MISGKVWGSTELIEANSALEFHRATIKKGGVCSKHKHVSKWNGFFVETGSVLIKVWKNEYNLVDETLLTAGTFTKVSPGEYHQFEAVEDSVMYEVYWSELNQDDIVRETTGFVK